MLYLHIEELRVSSTDNLLTKKRLEFYKQIKTLRLEHVYFLHISKKKYLTK